ncbi:MAG: hypothetical protein E6Q97_38350 [Desulfurellales bacterium]|nr:MAG: hypothetical protein E6Q97_38350 [Desulfurellales bacterium]
MQGISVRGNVVITFDSLVISDYMDDGSLETTVEAIETTTLASTGMESSAGMPSFKVPMGGIYKKALNDKLGVQSASPPAALKTLVVQIGPSGERVTYTWTASTTVGAFVGDYTIDFSDPKGVIKWKGTLEISGAPVLS